MGFSFKIRLGVFLSLFLGFVGAHGGPTLPEAVCVGNQCLDQLQRVVGQTTPDTLLNTVMVQNKLQVELFRASQLRAGLETMFSAQALDEAIRECREMTTTFKPPKYGTPEDLEAMCKRPEIVKEREKYDGFSPPFTDKYNRKKDAALEYARRVASTMSGLLLARIAVSKIKIASLEGRDEVIDKLPFPLNSCPNGKNEEFPYWHSMQEVVFENFKKSVKGPNLRRVEVGGDPAMVQELKEDVRKSEQLLASLCNDDIVSATAPFVADPRVGMLMFNAPTFDEDGRARLRDMVGFCRYGDIKERIEKFRGQLTWLFDGLTMVIGFFGPPGQAIATAANVGFYGIKTGQAYVKAEELRSEYLAGIRSGIETVSEDLVADAENEVVSTAMEAGIVMAVEGLSWATMTPLARIAGKKLLSLVRNSKELAEALASGALKLLDDAIEFAGVRISLKSLPSETIGLIKKAFQYLSKKSLAQAAKINLRALVDTLEAITQKYGAAAAERFEEILARRGRKALEKYGCRVLTVLGPGVSTAMWARGY